MNTECILFEIIVTDYASVKCGYSISVNLEMELPRFYLAIFYSAKMHSLYTPNIHIRTHSDYCNNILMIYISCFLFCCAGSEFVESR